MKRVFYLMIIIALIFVQVGYAEQKVYGYSGASKWEEVKVKDATLDELSKSINQGVKWGMVESSLITIGILIIASFFVNVIATTPKD